MSEEVERCPFCASKAVPRGGDDEWTVDCSNMDCGLVDFGRYPTRGEAIAAWNRRPINHRNTALNLGLLLIREFPTEVNDARDSAWKDYDTDEERWKAFAIGIGTLLSNKIMDLPPVKYVAYPLLWIFAIAAIRSFDYYAIADVIIEELDRKQEETKCTANQ